MSSLERADILFRCSASQSIGSGHFFRCLSLAASALDRGRTSLFAVTADFPKPLLQQLADRGISATPMSSRHGGLGDAQETMRMLRDAGARALVVDGYEFEGAFFEEISGARTLFIDDLFRSPPVDLILNVNPLARSERYELGPDLLLGPRFALLRPEFAQTSESVPPIREEIERVLVCIGGTDPLEATPEILRALQGRDVQITAIVQESSIDQLRQEFPHVAFRSNVAHMAAVMAASDLVFCGAGGMTWELACLGVPFIALEVADNQKDNVSALHDYGVPILADTSATSLDGALSRVASRANREKLRDILQSEVDGRGADRVLDALLDGLRIELGPATLEDCRFYYEVNNSPDVRAVSINSDDIAYSDHEQWFKSSLRNPARQLLVARLGSRPVGVLRFDLESNRATISLALHRAYRGRGLGSAMIKRGCEQLLEEVGDVVAFVRPSNVGSLRAFEKAGFQPDGRSTQRGVDLCVLKRSK